MQLILLVKLSASFYTWHWLPHLYELTWDWERNEIQLNKYAQPLHYTQMPILQRSKVKKFIALGCRLVIYCTHSAQLVLNIIDSIIFLGCLTNTYFSSLLACALLHPPPYRTIFIRFLNCACTMCSGSQNKHGGGDDLVTYWSLFHHSVEHDNATAFLFPNHLPKVTTSIWQRPLQRYKALMWYKFREQQPSNNSLFLNPKQGVAPLFRYIKCEVLSDFHPASYCEVAKY